MPDPRIKPETLTRKYVEARLGYVDEILQAVHGTPDLGNVADPLDELIFLLIGQRTRTYTAVAIARELRERFPDRRKLLNADHSQLMSVLSKAGRGNLRVKTIRDMLKAVEQRESKLSLSRLRDLNEQEAFEYLTSLPGVGEKIARCVMLYSLGIHTFPTDSNVIRILQRTKLVEPLIGPLEGIEHRKAQSLIAKAVPNSMAKTLHVNMVVHGQGVCLTRNPKCDECPIRKFCSYWRDTQVEAARSRTLTVADIFCGVGGISLGFHREGFRAILAVDNDHSVLQNYKLNHPSVDEEQILCRDVQSLTKQQLLKLVGKNEVDVLVAGVPCQGFSRIGYRTKPELAKDIKYRPERDPRNLLFKQVIRIARVLSPSLILLENVPDMQTANITHYGTDARVLDLLRRGLGRAGYKCESVLLEASELGVPQRRSRLFFVASRIGLPHDLEDVIKKIAVSLGFAEIRTLWDAIGDLPDVEPDSGTFVVNRSNGQSHGLVFNQVARFHNDDDMKIIRALEPGEKYAALVERKPEVLQGRTHRIYDTKQFRDKFYRMKEDEPGRTIVSHLAKDGNGFIHPTKDRSITVREAARVQTFPDDFMFIESRSTQFTGIGNAVPPVLAQIFARFFKELIQDARRGG